MAETNEHNYFIPQTTQEKIDAIRYNLRHNVPTGEITWAALRHKCGYEMIWGSVDNKRERQRFKDLLHQLADIEDLSNTRCRINKIYSEDKDVLGDSFDRRRVGNNSGKGIWQEQTKYALMLFLSRQIDTSLPSDKKQTLSLNSTYLGKVIGLVNQEYNSTSAEKLFLLENPSIKKHDIQNMKFHCAPIIKSVLRSALQNIQKLYGGISWRETYIFSEKIESANEGTLVMSEYTATQKDIHNIDAIYKRTVLDEMGVSTQRVVYLQNKQDEFYKRVLALYNEANGTNYTDWYQTFEICITPNQFYSAFNVIEKEFLSNKSLEESRKKCNKRFAERLEKNTIASYSSATRKLEKFTSAFSEDILDLIDLGFYTVEELVQEANLFKYHDSYLTNQEKCRNAFVQLS